MPRGGVARAHHHAAARAPGAGAEVRDEVAALGEAGIREQGPGGATDAIFSEFLPARTDGLVCGAGRAEVARRAVSVGSADPSAPAPAGIPAGVVFSRAVLHPEADPEPSLDI